jgi:uncharacterized membrane protein YfcA
MIIALSLTFNEAGFLVAVAFCAGMVRGFSGFALSALFMSLSVLILPPIALLPVCWVMEAVASTMLVRGGWSEADRSMALGLIAGVLFGMPIGLTVTGWMHENDSRLVALLMIIILASLQLVRIRIQALASKPGLIGSGILAGFATGIASLGGMVVALYVLSQDRPTPVMRATLIFYVMLSSVVVLIWLLTLGVMDWLAIKRGLAMSIPVTAGVLLGQFMFRPSVERYYKTFCLVLLLGLATASLLHTSGFVGWFG